MKEEIKKIIEPHFGHLNFLMKIKSDRVSISDIENLVVLLDNKVIISNLPKELHSYNSYYMLMKDIFFTQENYLLIRFIKENITSESKKVFLSVINDDDSINNFKKIINNIELRDLFLRWSSRIKDISSAKNYINSILNDSNILRNLDIEGDSRLVELTDYNSQKKLLPSSWCISASSSTFYTYIGMQRIFLIKYKNSIYGVNCLKNDLRILSIKDSSNNDINTFEGDFIDICNIVRAEFFKSSTLNIKLGGNNSIEAYNSQNQNVNEDIQNENMQVFPRTAIQNNVTWWQVEITTNNIVKFLTHIPNELLMRLRGRRNL